MYKTKENDNFEHKIWINYNRRNDQHFESKKYAI